MNWNLLVNVVNQIPNVVKGIEGIITDEKAGATKKQLAQLSLFTAASIAGAIDPNDTQQIAFFGNLTDVGIELFGATSGLFGKKS